MDAATARPDLLFTVYVSIVKGSAGPKYPNRRRSMRIEKAKRDGIDYLAACDLAWRLNAGQTLEEIARQEGRELSELQQDANDLFAAHPKAREFVLPDLPLSVSLVK